MTICPLPLGFHLVLRMQHPIE
uniref:Uncharacterized protein n=1 Tax=Anguilla anguilla TaxID=7936 RepID=A0A0E9PBI9_ANGAN